MGSDAPSFDDFLFTLKEKLNVGEHDELTGLCKLTEIKLGVFSWRKSKKSCEVSLKMIYDMMHDPEYKLRANVTRIFSGFTLDIYKNMDIGKHYWNYVNKDNLLKN